MKLSVGKQPARLQPPAQRINERLVRRPATAAHAQLEIPRAPALPQQEVSLNQRIKTLLLAPPRKETHHDGPGARGRGRRLWSSLAFGLAPCASHLLPIAIEV